MHRLQPAPAPFARGFNAAPRFLFAAMLLFSTALSIAAGPNPMFEPAQQLVRETSTASAPACKVEPFSDEAAAQREAQWMAPCGGDHVRWQVDSPKGKPDYLRPSETKAEFKSLTTHTIEGVVSTVKFAWAGTRDEKTGHTRSNSTTLAAGGLVRLHDDIDLQMNLGRQLAGAPLTRATITSSWRPTPRGLLFTEYATTSIPGADAQRVGARWWLIPRKLAVDFAAKNSGDGTGWRDQRLGLTLTGFKF